MASAYPVGIDSFTNPKDTDTLNSATVPHATQHTDANNAIVAIQTELGTNPSGIYSTVAARLDAASTVAYGSFEDSTTQSSGGTTTANLITFNTTSHSNGVSMVSGSRLTFNTAGTYVLNLLGQFFFSGGASNYNITVWVAKNGSTLANSAYTFTTTSSQGAQTLANLEDTYTVNAGDYFQFYWWAAAAGVTLSPTAAASNPTRPASPSANLNVWRIG
jgi:hypothetical protein